MIIGVPQLRTGGVDSSNNLLSNGGASFKTDVRCCFSNVSFKVEEGINQCDKACAGGDPESDAISGH